MRSPRTHALWTETNCPHFITTVTKNRERTFADEGFAKIVLDEMHGYADRYDVCLIAAVVMPDHVHCIILPMGKKLFIDYLRGVKSYSAKHINMVRRGQGTPPIDQSDRIHEYPNRRMSESKDQIWQDSFFDYAITDDEKLEEKIEYIIRNPVEDGLVKEDEKYPFLFVHPDYDPR